MTGWSERPGHRVIPAGEFKARCLKLMDEVAQNHQTIVITKRGKPVAQLSGAKLRSEQEVLDELRGSVLWEAPGSEPSSTDEWEDSLAEWDELNRDNAEDGK